jgi:hydrophobe/amphiphile efflux-1 (HAE1) family protein
VNLTRFSIQKPIGISMIIMLFVILGAYSFLRIGVELLPALNTPYVTVSVAYPGAGVTEIESQVVKPLEEALSSLSQLKHITSTARPERAMIILEFDFTANADMASIEATKKVNSIRGRLPDGVDEPVVVKRDMNASPILEIAVLSPDSLSYTYTKADTVFKERLQRAPGVSEVQLYGGRDKEVSVEVDPNKLYFYNVSLNQVVTKVRSENILLPAGTVYTDKSQTGVRLLSQYAQARDMEQIQIPTSGGSFVYLKDLATVREQESRVNRFSRTNGTDAISLSVYMNSNANIVETAKEALAQLETLKKEYPTYRFVVVSNAAQYVNNSLRNTMTSLIEGLITTGLVLFLFLRGWRSTGAVIVAIPTSIISTFFAMYLFGFTFNMMSLMGMALCVGILVDDSIVVLENIHRHIVAGKDSFQAAEDGRSEIGMAAIVITLCDVVVFLPIAFMTGMTGQFFRQFGLTIVFATLFSLLISFTLTPMMTSRLFKNGLEVCSNRVFCWMDALEERMENWYETALIWSFTHTKKLLVTITLVFFVTVAFIPLGIVGSEYMPQSDEGSFQVSVELPVGQTIEQTNQIVRGVEEYLETLPEVTNYLSSVGTPSSNTGRISVQLVGKRDRKRSVWQISADIRKYAAQNLTAAIVRVTETQTSVAGVSSSGGGGNTPIQIRVLGSNLENLIRSNYKLQETLTKINGVKDVRSNYTEGMPELQVLVSRDKARLYGTSVTEVSNLFLTAISGQSAGVLANDPTNDGQDTPIKVRLKDADGFTVQDIKSLPVTAGKTQIALGSVAAIQEATGPVTLYRLDKQRAITVQAGLTGRPLQEVLDEITQKLKESPLEEGITYAFAGQAVSMKDSFGEMIQALALSLVLIYILLAVLYESLATPLIRMLSLPFGLIGSIWFLWLTNNTINLYSLIGILVMDGLVAKNGTLLLDYTLQLMEQGKGIMEAVMTAGKTRLKPIIMTTVTMICGMLPTALALAEGAEARVSMAWVLIGGLLTSTIFTLIITPLVFVFLQTHSLRGIYDRFRRVPQQEN